MSSSKTGGSVRKPAFETPRITTIDAKRILELLGPAQANPSADSGCGCAG